MNTTQIQINTMTVFEADETAAIDGEWSAEKILHFTMEKGRSRQCYVAKIDGQIIGYMIVGPAGAWLMVQRLHTLTSDEALEALIRRAKCATRRINTNRAKTAYLACTDPELLAGVMCPLDPDDVRGSDLLRRNAFRAEEILKDEHGKTVVNVMTWELAGPPEKTD